MSARRWWRAGVLALVLAATDFAYGYGVGKREWWPYAVARQAELSGEALKQRIRDLRHRGSRYVHATDRTLGGVVAYEPGLASPGYTFVTAWRNGRFGASLIDMEGHTVHNWDVAVRDIYASVPPFSATMPRDADVNIEGALLYPNGDVVLNLYEVGTVRLDRCSHVLWTLARPTNHSVEAAPDGALLIPSHGEPGRKIEPQRFRVGPGEEGYYKTESLLFVDPATGQVQREIPLLEDLQQSGFDAALVAGSAPGMESHDRVDSEDPLHLNDIEMLSPEMAERFPLFEAGDLLVSMSRISFIMVLDGRTARVKWALSGEFHMQYDPDFMPNGHILLFDNRVNGHGRVSRGQDHTRRSRVIELDPVSQRIVWSYDGGDSNPFYADARGRVELLPNGNVLIVDSEEGRAFEVSRERGDRVVWDYVNMVEPGRVGMLIDARRYPGETLEFLDKSCPA
jgi:hypothetical protein